MKSDQENLLNKRNAELEKQLAQKTRDLEIEGALEKVRSSALAMRVPADMLEVCRIICGQLGILHIKEIRNVQTAVFNEDKKTYTNYEYYRLYDKSFITEVEYGDHPVHNAFAKEMLTGPGLLFAYTFEGEELREWIAYQKASGQFADPHLDEVTSVNYYWFSLGPVAWGITFYAPVNKAELEIIKRFRNVFDLAYRRFADIQKAEEQAREAQIQLALERVRARTMAMQRSEELAETVFILFRQFKELGENPDQATIGIMNEDEGVIEYWVTMHGNQNNRVYKFSLDEPNVTRKIYDAWKNQKRSLVIDLSGKALLDFMHYRSSMGGAPANKAEKRRIINVAFFSKGLINVQSTQARSEESVRLLERFAGVFEGTYTRFLDLQRAEAQVREAQIEAALEKVRSRSLAMHQTDELREVVSVVFDKLHDLEIVMEGEAASIVIFTEGTKDLILWNAIPGQSYSMSFHIPYHDTVIISSLLEARGMDFYSRAYTFEEKDSHWKWALEHSDYKYLPEERKQFILASAHFACSVSFTKNSAILVSSYVGKLLSEKESEILKRFARVFEQAYVRFLDLHKAEVQAREAQIELSLERVRAKTMAMHTSDHVGETVATMFDELVKLGIERTVRCGILIIDETKHMEVWTAAYNTNGKVDMLIGRIDMMVHPLISNIHEAWKNKEQVKTYELVGQDLKAYYKAVNDSPEYPVQFDLASLPAKQTNNAFFFPEGAIFAFTLEPLSADEVKLFKRFAAVFGLTYRRFLDLQRAEAQARESQIQLGLERVRAKAMAMQNSDGLNGLVGTLFEELTRLDFVLARCMILIVDPDTLTSRWWIANSETPTDPMNYFVQYHANPAYLSMLNAWRESKQIWSYELKGKVKRDWDDFLFIETELSKLPAEVIKNMKAPERVLITSSFNHFGWLALVSMEPLSIEHSDILLRFAKVFDMSYTRFNDLKKAEAQAREAIKQASVDRVRGEIASMRTTNDLERITPLIWSELTILGIPFIRCGVFIVDEEEELIHSYLSTPDGKALAAFDLQFDSDGIGQDVLPAWQSKQIVTIHWSEEEFAAYTKTLVDRGTITPGERYVTEHPDTSLDLHFFPFLQGMLYVGNVVSLTDDEKDLVQSLADAFSTAYARYEDFNKLEAAKQQVENTLTDLKATQTKLIQSEKMASLGELTAGIAHEIQNPLNFVNNFSEVNQEMIEELEEELKAGNVDEALALAADIKGNEQKINHHGKRADGIVKGMLAHSRTGGGEKETTNINTLADEFMRLAYHGLRAKDKTFNAELVTNFDANLPKINVIPQDMGRVMLNLFNNAFYAVNQKMKASIPGYKPEVSVTTEVDNGQVLIKVKDNGIGMPEHIKEKIMQPFFTTKPTGEGTGLGLSLTYDMVVKGHGGSISVNTKEFEFTEFIIDLPIA